MKLKTKDLTGPALDWAVAKASDRLGKYIRDDLRLGTSIIDIDFDEHRQLAVYVPGRKHDPYVPWAPSTDWAQGGPLIDASDIVEIVKGGYGESVYWEVISGMEDEPGHTMARGPTKLIAAFRCIVAAKLGDEVDIPDELT